MSNDAEHKLPLDAANLLDLCLRLRMAANGSADPIAEDAMEEALRYLRLRVSEWRRSTRRSARFDECVRQLVLATIAEVEQRVTYAPETT